MEAKAFKAWISQQQRVLLWIVAGLLAINLIRLVPNTRSYINAQAQGSSAVPYTISLTERAIGANGFTVIKHFTRALRADGAEVTVERGTFRHERTNEVIPYTRRQIVAPPGVRSFVYDDFRMSSSAKYAGGNFGFWRITHRDPASDCLKAFNGQRVLVASLSETVLAHEVLNGLRTIKIQMPKQIQPDLKIWYALDCGCEIVGQQAIFRDTTDEKYVDHMRTGPPDPSLFEIPVDYREVAPSELDRRSFATYGMYDSGNSVPAPVLREWERLDESFYRNRP